MHQQRLQRCNFILADATFSLSLQAVHRSDRVLSGQDRQHHHGGYFGGDLPGVDAPLPGHPAHLHSISHHRFDLSELLQLLLPKRQVVVEGAPDLRHAGQHRALQEPAAGAVAGKLHATGKEGNLGGFLVQYYKN